MYSLEEIFLDNKTLLVFIYILVVIGITIVMFANSIKRRSTLGVILSIINIWIPFIPLIIYLVKIYYEKVSNNTKDI